MVVCCKLENNSSSSSFPTDRHEAGDHRAPEPRLRGSAGLSLQPLREPEAQGKKDRGALREATEGSSSAFACWQAAICLGFNPLSGERLAFCALHKLSFISLPSFLNR